MIDRKYSTEKKRDYLEKLRLPYRTNAPPRSPDDQEHNTQQAGRGEQKCQTVLHWTCPSSLKPATNIHNSQTKAPDLKLTCRKRSLGCIIDAYDKNAPTKLKHKQRPQNIPPTPYFPLATFSRTPYAVRASQALFRRGENILTFDKTISSTRERESEEFGGKK